MTNPFPTSPNLNTGDGIVATQKQFSDALTLDLTDDEIKEAVRIIVDVKAKYNERWRFTYFDSMEKVADEIEAMRDEVSTRLAERLNVLASVDGTPVFMGQPPVIEIIGRIPGTSFDKYGMDHEKKEWEVKQAAEAGEDFYGQKK